MHIVKSECVRRECANRRGLFPAVAARRQSRTAFIGPVIGVLMGRLRSPRISRAGSSPRRILSFRLAQQAILIAGSLAKPMNVVLRILPCHADHGMFVILREAELAP